MRHHSEIQGIKEKYMRQEMSAEQYEKLKQTIQLAKKENVKDRKIQTIRGITSVAAIFVLGFVVWTNSLTTIAYAMEKIPVIVGGFVKVVTLGKHEFEDERSRLKLEIPQLETGADTITTEAEEDIKEINAEIMQIADGIKKEFEAYHTEENGYHETIVESQIVANTEKYFTLKLICYEGAADGAEKNYFYTIDLETGNRLELKDLFIEGSNYIAVISDEIKSQMQAQMKLPVRGNNYVTYWLGEEVEEMNFTTITDDTSFYLNQKGELVIAFNEGEVAPMSMGSVEFEIASELLEDIRK